MSGVGTLNTSGAQPSLGAVPVMFFSSIETRDASEQRCEGERHVDRRIAQRAVETGHLLTLGVVSLNAPRRIPA